MSGVLLSRDPREERLPKWAQERMADLRDGMRQAARDRDEARLATDPHESDAVLDPWAPIPVGLGKGRDARVRFRLGDEGLDQWADVQVVETRAGRYLEVHGGNSLRIVPQVSNVIRVEVSPR